MTTKLKVVDVTKITGRSDVLAVVDLVEGELLEECNRFVRVGTDNLWQITSIGTHPPGTNGENGVQRLPLGLESIDNDQLSAGDILESVDVHHRSIE